MSVKSLSITKWDNTMVIESMTHWWKPAAFAVLRTGRQWGHSPDWWLQTVKLLKQVQIQRKERNFTFRWRQTVKKAKRPSARKKYRCGSLSLGLVGTTSVYKYKICSTQIVGRCFKSSHRRHCLDLWEMRSKNTSAITTYRHRCHQRERHEDLWDGCFKITTVTESRSSQSNNKKRIWMK